MQKTIYAALLLGGLLLSSSSAKAQAKPTVKSGEVDLSVTYNGLYRNTTNPDGFWEQGGAVGLSGNFYGPWGAAMSITGEHASKIVDGGYDLSTVTTVFGPRYTVQRGKKAFFGEALLGESHGFNSYFPHTGGALNNYDSFAWQVGGGVDLRFSRRFSLRALQASWLRTYFPNATTNVQNSIQFGAGIVVRLANPQLR